LASKFAKDLKISPSTRGVTDVAHKIVAVASRSKEKAESFAKEFCGGLEGINCYATYEEFYKDPVREIFNLRLAEID
jgi:predicted dehydrogenase